MAERQEVYVINATDGQRAAVPKAHFESNLKDDGWVIDPDGPSAADADPKTIKAAERTIERAAVKRETAAAEASE